MWMFFCIIAVVTALLNVVWTVKGKDGKWFRFISLSFTALTLCAFYNTNAKWVINEDWGALSDVTPTTAKSLWVYTIVSIAINSVSLFKAPQK